MRARWTSALKVISNSRVTTALLFLGVVVNSGCLEVAWPEMQATYTACSSLLFKMAP